MESIIETFNNQGYFAAICTALRQGMNVIEAENFVGKLRQELLETEPKLSDKNISLP